MKKPKNKNPYAKPTPSKSKRPIIAIAILALTIIGLTGNYIAKNAGTYKAASEFNARSNQILNTAIQENKHDYHVLPDDQCGVFVSYSNGTDRAQVRYGIGKDLKSAWRAADNSIQIQDDIKYLKYDVIYNLEPIKTLDLRLKLSVTPIESWQYGIIFDKQADLSHALLKSEIDALKPYDTNTWEFNTLQINGYFYNNGRQQLKNMPMDAQIFNCDSWLYDVQNDKVISLESEKKQNSLRKLELNPATISTMIQTANQHLANRIKPDGEFEYALFPLTLDKIDEYSSVRHVGTLWAMCQNAGLTGNKNIKPDIDRSIEYLIANCIVYDGDSNAYFIESYSDDIEIGGTGLAITMLQTYANVFETNQYDDLIENLANSLIKYQQESGKIPHILDREFNITQDFLIIYFDGEADLGLFRAYKQLKSPEILTAAVKLFEYFTASDYQEQGDHWLAYAADEITQIYPDKTEYYYFAFNNAQSAFDKIEYSQVISPTDFELLVNTYKIYLRAVENNIPIPENFDYERLIRMTHEQAERQLNRYMLPEKAMYSKACNEIIGAFYVDIVTDWRLRIDDVQHCTNGYCLYYDLIEQTT